MNEEPKDRGLALVMQSDLTQSAAMPIRWCVSRSVLEDLKGDGVLDPQILIIVWHSPYSEKRYMVPLGDMMTYIAFRKPGRNIVHAVIMAEGAEYLYKRCLRRSGGAYDTDLVSRTGELLEMRYRAVASETVEVDERFFAKKPPQWLSSWVNRWFEGKPVDECAFRRRAILAFTLQPPCLGLFWLGKSVTSFLCALWLLLLGKRGINLAPIVKPWRYELRDVWAKKRQSVFTQDDALVFLAPVNIIFVCFGGALLRNNLHKGSESLTETLLWTLGLLAAEYGFVLLIVGIAALCAKAASGMRRMSSRFDSWMNDAESKSRAAKEQQKPTKLEALYDIQLKPLLCTASASTFVPNYRTLPKERQTLRLKFLDLKARVCRPFAG